MDADERHRKPISIWQLALHPSPEMALLSSQLSAAEKKPSPHVAAADESVAAVATSKRPVRMVAAAVAGNWSVVGSDQRINQATLLAIIGLVQYSTVLYYAREPCLQGRASWKKKAAGCTSPCGD